MSCLCNLLAFIKEGLGLVLYNLVWSLIIEQWPFTEGYLLQLFHLRLQEKQALEKRVSDMEGEIKVSPCRNKMCIITRGYDGIYMSVLVVFAQQQ